MLVEKTPNINFTNIASLRDANHFCYAVCYQYVVPSGTEFLFDHSRLVLPHVLGLSRTTRGKPTPLTFGKV
jgi:hypothetical protein